MDVGKKEPSGVEEKTGDANSRLKCGGGKRAPLKAPQKKGQFVRRRKYD